MQFRTTSSQSPLSNNMDTTPPDINVVTRRSTRSFVEDEMDADLRELQQGTAAVAAAEHSLPQSGQPGEPGQLSDIIANGNRLSLAVRTNMERSIAFSSGASSRSSGASSVSSTYSSTSTSPATGLGAAIDGLLNEGDAADDEPAADDGPAVAPGAPVNFGFVMPGLFRSSYPRPENYDFLQQLGLKTIVTLVDKNYTEEYRDFIAGNAIQHHMFAMKGTKKEDIPLATMEAILNLVLDRRNYPMLIHCNQGRHRTGCVVAVVRTIAGWDRGTVADEYRAYAGRKVRECDVAYIQAFSLGSIEKLLASDAVDVDQLTVDSRPGGPMVGRPPPTTVGFRVPNFFRTTFFSMTVLFIWVLSGSKMPLPTKR